MSKSFSKPLVIAVMVVGATYPFMVYFGLQVFSPLVIAASLLVLLVFRIFVQWGQRKTIEVIALLMTVTCVGFLMLFDHMLAVKAYPVAFSLSLAGVFSYSVLYPPTIIERFARIYEPNLNDRGVDYTRRVTFVWITFFIINSIISLGVALYKNIEVWTYYNGFLSYIIAGTIMGVELIVRHFVKKHHVGES